MQAEVSKQVDEAKTYKINPLQRPLWVVDGLPKRRKDERDRSGRSPSYGLTLPRLILNLISLRRSKLMPLKAIMLRSKRIVWQEFSMWDVPRPTKNLQLASKLQLVDSLPLDYTKSDCKEAHRRVIEFVAIPSIRSKSTQLLLGAAKRQREPAPLLQKSK